MKSSSVPDFINFYLVGSAASFFLENKLWCGEFWSDGFYMAQVNELRSWKVLEKYVANQ